MLTSQQRDALRGAVLAESAFADLVGVDWNVERKVAREESRAPRDPRDADVAAWLNAPHATAVRVSTCYVNARQLMAKLGALSGATILETFDRISKMDPKDVPAAVVLRWAMPYIVGAEGINIGDPETRSAIDGLIAAGVMEAATGQALKRLAERGATRAEAILDAEVGALSAADVSIIMRGD